MDVNLFEKNHFSILERERKVIVRGWDVYKELDVL